MNPMLATVGEQQPEAIMPLDKLGSMMSGMKGRWAATSTFTATYTAPRTFTTR